jgi:hypothetical protein
MLQKPSRNPGESAEGSTKRGRGVYERRGKLKMKGVFFAYTKWTFHLSVFNSVATVGKGRFSAGTSGLAGTRRRGTNQK